MLAERCLCPGLTNDTFCDFIQLHPDLFPFEIDDTFEISYERVQKYEVASINVQVELAGLPEAPAAQAKMTCVAFRCCPSRVPSLI